MACEYPARPLVEVPVSTERPSEGSFTVPKTGAYAVYFVVRTDGIPAETQRMLDTVLFEPGQTAKEFDFTWRITAAGRQIAAGDSSRGVSGSIQYGGGGLGAPAFHHRGGRIGRVSLEAGHSYAFHFSPGPAFAALSVANPTIRFEPDRSAGHY